MTYLRLIAALAVLAAALAVARGPAAADQAVPPRLVPSVTVEGDIVTLGDLFDGDITRPEKVVAQAPAPGQRYILSADWLASLARSQGLTWRPSGPYDRAMVSRPGQTIAVEDLLDAAKTELIRAGMPANYGLRNLTPLAPVTIATDAARAIGVREPMFDAAASTYSAVLEIPAGDPNAAFVPLRGVAVPVVAVPVPAETWARNTIITREMIAIAEVAETELGRDTVLTAAELIGTATRNTLRAGRPVSAADVARVSLVDIPVLARDMRRGEEITPELVTWATVDANALPADAATDEAALIGKSPRRVQAAGAPVRRSDLQSLRPVVVAVLNRDLRRGEAFNPDDIHWTTVDASDTPADALTEGVALVGRIATHSLRAGQTLRVNDIAMPAVIGKGKLVTIQFSTPIIQLTARGTALEPGGIGEVIRVANTKSNMVVLAEITGPDTVRLAELPTN
ncbi:MAG: flagellar basal body P-ring formation chaperone FlgA [Rhodospirillaceae bacterium]|nr:flagellar basal body P-ring formation chaperone FlgA [Rhodospirillaceae bacterium]